MDSNKPKAAPPDWPAEVPYRSWKSRAVRVTLIVAGLIAAFVAGGLLLRGGENADAPATSAGTAAAPEVWTCSMHPQVRLPAPGQCPICFMDLIPVEAGAGNEDAPVLTLGPRAQVLARVETAPVERRALTRTLRLVGKVAPDESRLVYVSSYIPGRIDRLFVDYTGIFVRAGDHLAEIYSPDLLVAQREYLLALENLAQTDAATTDRMTRQAAEGLLDAARRKLQLWGIPADELARLERERTATDQMRIDAPAGGWVLERSAYPGMYVETGTRLFTLADLGSVWVLLDAYELDIGLIRIGQEVTFEAEAYAGEEFTGRVAYIDPVLNPQTRTVKVRLNVDNPGTRLRPEMFVRARLNVRLGAGGEVIETALAGKYVCYMHPNVVKDAPGACDICGMDLVPAESLGYASAAPVDEKALAVPQSAVLLTGTRAVVYVAHEADGQQTFEGRVIALGPQAGDYYVVKSGLAEGERVAVQGALMIDSALQIQARPSMMQPEAADAAAAAESAPPAPAARSVAGAMYHQHMAPVIRAYLDLSEALSADDLEKAQAALRRLRDGLKEAAPHGLTGADAELFSRQVADVASALPESADPDMATLRTRLDPLTAALAVYLRTFGHAPDQPIVRLHCPMAFNDRGADWFQPDDQVRNPYFGKQMYRCGVKRGVIAADGEEVSE